MAGTAGGPQRHTHTHTHTNEAFPVSVPNPPVGAWLDSPSSLPSQANKQLEPRQNTSSHTRDPAPSHVDLLHPDLHLAVPLDVAQHSNNRRSSGARQSPLSFPLRDINRWQVPVDQQHPSRFHHAPTASAPTARPASGVPDPEWLGDFEFIPSDADAVKTSPEREGPIIIRPQILATVLPTGSTPVRILSSY